VLPGAVHGRTKRTRNVGAIVNATATVNRMDYGVSWNKVLEGGGLVLSKDITITIQVEATKKKKK